ncbi:MAG: DUF393 domain-containing protein [Firmicutes bacterium]|uniref:DUF393 domain-containing protein n=1 Tax=Sulfobacillus benefaciens TaxID=453960 RepID=A0A2T2WSG8_9FIRM|nr:DUF393 domain-containing protein [Bacillota bacterium]MCL5015461.1 DUF393 domain-containing protein [Bacillota bacterium]PSR25188.1 MAG: hypothetical protein C7B43_17475 [Sulfobacillus benefaciens]
MENDSSIVVFYDEDCPACQIAVKQWKGCDEDKQLTFTSCRMPQSQQIVGDKAVDEIHVVRQGTVYSGVAALLEIYRRLPRLRYILWILLVARALGLADPLYRWFAKNRMVLGQLVK